jgi:hypothetical protein
MVTPSSQDLTSKDGVYPLMTWWLWPVCTAGLWLIPGAMMAIWSVCYATVFGEPGPYYPWSVVAIDSLGAANFVAVAVYIYLLRRHLVSLVLGMLIVPVEVIVTLTIWALSGASVGGLYF